MITINPESPVTLSLGTAQLEITFVASDDLQLQHKMGKGMLSLLLWHLWLRLVSIVHGSLARAGKVKSQTPKVDKQEKKKPPKGRAKKRILYNRR